MLVAFKVVFEHSLGDDIRKRSLSLDDLTFAVLLDTIKAAYGFQGRRQVFLKYLDEDGEQITLANETDMRELILQLRRHSIPPPVRLFVGAGKPPSAQPRPKVGGGGQREPDKAKDCLATTVPTKAAVPTKAVVPTRVALAAPSSKATEPATSSSRYANKANAPAATTSHAAASQTSASQLPTGIPVIGTGISKPVTTAPTPAPLPSFPVQSISVPSFTVPSMPVHPTPLLTPPAQLAAGPAGQGVPAQSIKAPAPVATAGGAALGNANRGVSDENNAIPHGSWRSGSSTSSRSDGHTNGNVEGGDWKEMFSEVAFNAAPCEPRAVHWGIVCDGCESTPLVGVRYKSLDRPDFDLCETCKRSGSPASLERYEAIPQGRPRKKKGGRDQRAGQVAHHGVRCDGCDEEPLMGLRFKSLDRPDYDLCEPCKNVLDMTVPAYRREAFVRMDRPRPRPWQHAQSYTRSLLPVASAADTAVDNTQARSSAGDAPPFAEAVAAPMTEAATAIASSTVAANAPAPPREPLSQAATPTYVEPQALAAPPPTTPQPQAVAAQASSTQAGAGPRPQLAPQQLQPQLPPRPVSPIVSATQGAALGNGRRPLSPGKRPLVADLGAHGPRLTPPVQRQAAQPQTQQAQQNQLVQQHDKQQENQQQEKQQQDVVKSAVAPGPSVAIGAASGLGAVLDDARIGGAGASPAAVGGSVAAAGLAAAAVGSTPVIRGASLPRVLSPRRLLDACFVCDVNYPDGSEVTVGAPFTKAWRVRNAGLNPWPSTACLLHVGGDDLAAVLSGAITPHTAATTTASSDGGSNATSLVTGGSNGSGIGPSMRRAHAGVPPGGEVDLVVPMRAPRAPGTYESYFKLAAGRGGPLFGHRVWCSIVAVEALPPPTAPVREAVEVEAERKEPAKAESAVAPQPADEAAAVVVTEAIIAMEDGQAEDAARPGAHAEAEAPGAFQIADAGSLPLPAVPEPVVAPISLVAQAAEDKVLPALMDSEDDQDESMPGLEDFDEDDDEEESVPALVESEEEVEEDEGEAMVRGLVDEESEEDAVEEVPGLVESESEEEDDDSEMPPGMVGLRRGFFFAGPRVTGHVSNSAVEAPVGVPANVGNEEGEEQEDDEGEEIVPGLVYSDASIESEGVDLRAQDDGKQRSEDHLDEEEDHGSDSEYVDVGAEAVAVAVRGELGADVMPHDNFGEAMAWIARRTEVLREMQEVLVREQQRKSEELQKLAEQRRFEELQKLAEQQLLEWQGMVEGVQRLQEQQRLEEQPIVEELQRLAEQQQPHQVASGEGRPAAEIQGQQEQVQQPQEEEKREEGADDRVVMEAAATLVAEAAEAALEPVMAETLMEVAAVGEEVPAEGAEAMEAMEVTPVAVVTTELVPPLVSVPSGGFEEVAGGGASSGNGAGEGAGEAEGEADTAAEAEPEAEGEAALGAEAPVQAEAAAEAEAKAAEREAEAEAEAGGEREDDGAVEGLENAWTEVGEEAPLPVAHEHLREQFAGETQNVAQEGRQAQLAVEEATESAAEPLVAADVAAAVEVVPVQEVARAVEAQAVVNAGEIACVIVGGASAGVAEEEVGEDEMVVVEADADAGVVPVYDGAESAMMEEPVVFGDEVAAEAAEKSDEAKEGEAQGVVVQEDAKDAEHEVTPQEAVEEKTVEENAVCEERAPVAADEVAPHGDEEQQGRMLADKDGMEHDHVAADQSPRSAASSPLPEEGHAAPADNHVPTWTAVDLGPSILPPPLPPAHRQHGYESDNGGSVSSDDWHFLEVPGEEEMQSGR